MAQSVDNIAEEIRELPDVEKLRLVHTIFSDLDKPDPKSTESGQRRPSSGGQRTKRARCQLSPVSPSWPNNANREGCFPHPAPN